MSLLSHRNVSHSYIVFENTLKPLSEDEEIGIVIYIAEKHRRKPRFLRRTTRVERINYIVKIDYPFIIYKLRDNFALIFDGFREESIKIEYYDIARDSIDREINELEYLRGKTFLDKLVFIENISKNIADLAENIVKKEIVIKNIILTPDLNNELSQLFNKTTTYTHKSLKLTLRELPIMKYIDEINELIDTISKNHGYVMSIISRVEKYSEKWKENISSEYVEKIRELENKLNIIKEEVKLKVEEISNRLREEIERKHREYDSLINSFDNKIIELRNKLKNIEDEERKLREYGGELKDIKRKKKEVEKELVEYSKKRDEYVAKKEEEIKNIEDKYNKLIESERSRIREIEDQIKRINEELENLIKLCNSRVVAIKDYLMKFLDRIKSIEKRIFDSLISIPMEGEGVYWIPIYVIQYRSVGKERIYAITPLKINLSRKLKSLKISYFEKIRDYLINISELIETPVYKQLVSGEYNILINIPLERIENSFAILVNNGVISNKEYSIVIKNIREQIDLMK